MDFVMAMHKLLKKNTEDVIQTRIPSSRAFTRIHHTLHDTGSFPSFSLQSEREAVGTINTRENIRDGSEKSVSLHP
jgi:hypothetical protein